MSRYHIRTKADVQTSYHDNNSRNPMLNVKESGWDRTLHTRVVEKFGCDDDVASTAIDLSTDSAREMFWDCVEGEAQEIFGKPVRVWSAGRSGGWLVVEGLKDVEAWDARDLSKWKRLAKWVDAEIAHLMDIETRLDDIEMNRWAEAGAERYNFRDTAKGTICVADLNQALAKAKDEIIDRLAK